MRKRLIAKGNIHKADYARAIVTDTIPGDIPIIVSNDGFYRNLRRPRSVNINYQLLVDLILKDEGRYTIPYRYNILRSGGGTRRLSLLHPRGQIAIAEFYRSYGDLICYYSRKSEASLRSPRKVGSLFFVKGPISEKNKLKGAGIDTVDIEKSVSNPASYFSYKGVDRAFKFFQTTEYVRLEKTYRVMHFADVSKCFSSIYTHTLFWATADVKTAKDNTLAEGFSNRFDRIMQSINYNETNGICIGPEVSRIFAELILSEIDARAIENLSYQELKFGKNYEFRRYVDDFYIFSESEAVAAKVLSAISLALSEFNLHFNSEKTHSVPRPFITAKSRLIRDASAHVEAFFGRFIGTGRLHDRTTYSYPKIIRRSPALLRSLLDSIKATCFDNESGYEGVTNYVISALVSRIIALVSDYDLGISHEEVELEHYVSSIMLLLEAVYFFYNVDPSVPSSLRVSQAAIWAFDFFTRKIPDRAPFLSEQLVRWTIQFVRSVDDGSPHRSNDCVPLEALNILLVLGEVGRNEVLAQSALSNFSGSVSKLMYFEIVSILFCIKDTPEFDRLRDDLFERCRVIVASHDVRLHAHSVHLALDILSCPYIAPQKRVVLFNDLRQQVGLATVSVGDALAAVSEFQQNPWFVDWDHANLLRMIRKKELSAVY